MKDDVEFFPIFPTMIARSNVVFSETEKNAFFNVLLHQFDTEGKTGEARGYLALQKIDVLFPIFEACIKVVKKKLRYFHVDPEGFDINITKAWMNVVNNRSTPLHGHYDAHWSFTYYLNVPEQFENRLQFEQIKHPNDPYRGLIGMGASHFDEYNAMTMQYMPKEGDIYVFPGDLLHCTVADNNADVPSVKTLEDFKTSRVCIAGDIFFTHKYPTSVYLGVQPKKKWLTF